MCGPKFCSMKITQDIRDYASVLEGEESGRPATDVDADSIRAGLEEKAAEFRDKGSEIYVDATGP
jgi:phosphomethylpyrimidine synthase